MTTQETEPRSATFAELFGTITAAVGRAIRGKADVVELAVLCLVSEGHLLLEDVPGVGKTTLAKALAASVDCEFGRIQFTPDLLPSDVVGVTVWNRSADVFEFRPGPVFASIVLGDEINRASPKTQSALLEAMAENQVTVDGTTYPLGPPFMVIATQNPIEHEGTYPLPESQLDRFLMKASVGYPDRASELEVLDTHGDAVALAHLSPVATAADVNGLIAAARTVHASPLDPGLPGRPRRRHPPPPPPGPRHVAPGHAVAAARRPLPGRRRRAGPTSSPTTSRPSPSPSSPTASWSPRRPSSRASARPTPSARCWPPSPCPRRPVRPEPVLTRRGWFTGVLAGVLLVLGRVFGTIEGYIAGRRAGRPADRLGAVAGAPPGSTSSVTRVLHPPRVHAGSSTRVDLAVVNRARRASPVLTLRDRVSGTRGASLLVAPLDPGGETRAAYRFATERRGRRHRRPARRSSSPTRSGWPACASRPPASPSWSCYPPIETLPAVPLSAGNDPLAGSEHPNALGRGGEDFFALRAYVVGDDLRRVHWPATARHDELMVRQDELPWQGRTTVVIDDRAGVHTAESFERMVSAAASILVAGTRRQDLVRVVTASGSDSGFGAGRAHVEGLLEALACIEPQGGTDLAGAGEVLGATGVSGALVVLTGGAAPDELTRLVARAEPSGPEALLSFAPGATGGPTVAGPVVRWAPTPRSRPAGPRPCAAAPAARAPPPGGRVDHHPAAPHGARPRRRPPPAARRPPAEPARRRPVPGPGPAPAAHRGRPRRHDLRRGRRVRPHLRLVELPRPAAGRGPGRPRHHRRLPPAGLRGPDRVRHHHRRVVPGGHLAVLRRHDPRPDPHPRHPLDRPPRARPLVVGVLPGGLARPGADRVPAGHGRRRGRRRLPGRLGGVPAVVGPRGPGPLGHPVRLRHPARRRALPAGVVPC